ncbi:hypothetical protein PSQ90_13790 [Devosia rhodophyticola]|uniref:Uncharacterized protein n=1 Tax=Devosia rhodophyticola TaxID=3026423 RepID=A0ABY7YVF6_9HYPH|nr:hypothetical protein [Devosia rhodophyticola]WDR05345.1 hypothetical protein PSQ90_13790 [Devosia rhodophyticola]
MLNVPGRTFCVKFQDERENHEQKEPFPNVELSNLMLPGKSTIALFREMSPRHKSIRLVELAIFVGFLPAILFGLGIRGLVPGIFFFATNLVICMAGFLTSRLRFFWVTWAIASVIGFLAFGMSTPVGALKVLWAFLTLWA